LATLPSQMTCSCSTCFSSACSEALDWVWWIFHASCSRPDNPTSLNWRVWRQQSLSMKCLLVC